MNFGISQTKTIFMSILQNELAYYNNALFLDHILHKKINYLSFSLGTR